MVLKDAIKKYTDSLIGKKQRELNSIQHTLEQLENYCSKLKRDITQTSLTEFQIAISGFIVSYPRDKEKCRERIKGFLTFLKKNYLPGLNIEESLPALPVSDKLERQIEILKKLHFKQRQQDIAGELSVSAVTLSKDLAELQNGVTILGQKIKIEKELATDQYRSTVHPVFLPLNLTEVYALTVGLKKLAKQVSGKSVYEDLADCIYSQLSDYARDIIDQASKREDVCFHNADTFKGIGFRKEKTLIETKRDYRLMYLRKSGSQCRVFYEDDGTVHTVEGRVCWGDDTGSNGNYICIQTEKGRIKLDSNKVVNIEMKYR